MDYGHPLVFGVQLGTAEPDRAIDLAKLVEELGYDYLAFNSSAAISTGQETLGLDPWTFGAFIAGNTGTVMLRAQVPSQLNPPLIARSSASLDILSGGRTDIALGPETSKETDSENLRDRIYEQVTIIRGMWNTGEALPLKFHGDHYQVPGAKRGPAPDHNVGLWISGTTPELIEIAGELADGWALHTDDLILTEKTFAHVLAQVERLNQQADAAAISNGRDPRELRRQIVVNQSLIPGLEQQNLADTQAAILKLVEAGFAEILFDSASQDHLTWLAKTVKPHVETILSTTRKNAGTGIGVLRSSAIRARRIGAIDYDAIPESLKKVSVEPGDGAHPRYRNTYLRGGNPGLVINARTVKQVQDAVAYAATQNVPFSIRSGGHGFSGKSTNNGGIVLNLRGLRDITVLDPQTGTVRVEPGAQWAEVAQKLDPYGLAITSGDSGSVGVGGLATVGGIGFFSKEFGLTIDRVLAMEIVTATGEIVRASATENPELFWGMRGAGPNFGVVTAFEFKAHRAEALAHVQLTFAVENLAEFFENYGQLVEETPNDTTLFLMSGPSQYGQPTNVMLYGIVNSADKDVVLERLQPFAYLSPLIGQQVYLTTYAAAIGAPSTGAQHGRGEPISRAGALPHISATTARDLARIASSEVVNFFQIRTTGGAASAVPEDATAFTGRADNFHVLVMGTEKERLNMVWDSVQELSDSYYLNFETDIRPERVQRAFTPQKWERLVALKRAWDPGNLFKDNFNILP